MDVGASLTTIFHGLRCHVASIDDCSHSTFISCMWFNVFGVASKCPNPTAVALSLEPLN